MKHPVTGCLIPDQAAVVKAGLLKRDFVVCHCGNTFVRWNKEAECGQCAKAKKKNRQRLKFGRTKASRLLNRYLKAWPDGDNKPVWQEKEIPYRTKSKTKTNAAKREKVHAKTNGRCWFCGIEIGLNSANRSERMTMDHLTPICQGGKSGLFNLAPSCHACNNDKGSRNLEQYRFAKQLETGAGVHFFWFEEERLK